MNRLLIIDGHNLLFQMFFGMPSSIPASDGSDIRGVVGFIGVDNPRKHSGNCGQVQTMALFLADRIQKDKTKDRLQELLNH